MADHSKPVLTSTYANFVSELDARFDDLSVGLDPAVVTATNVPVSSIRWSSASNTWQKWDGSAWNPWTSALVINGTFNATLNAAVGGALSSSNGLNVTNSALAGTTQRGIASAPVATSAATALVTGVEGSGNTAAAAFTTASSVGLYAKNATKGSGSTITSQHGVYVEDQTQGTSNYGITSNVSAAANKWNIYSSGTASNYFNGAAFFGGTSTTAALRVSHTAPKSTLYAAGSAGSSLALSTSTAAGAETERVVIDSAGSVGVGITPSAWGVLKPIEFQGGAYIAAETDNLYLGSNNYYNGTNYIYKTADFAAQYRQVAGNHTWFTAASGVAGGTVTFSQPMTLNTAGQLLLGNTTYSATPVSGVTVNPASASAINIGHTSGTATGASFMNFAYNGASIGALTQNATTGIELNGGVQLKLTGTSVVAPTPNTASTGTEVATAAFVNAQNYARVTTRVDVASASSTVLSSDDARITGTTAINIFALPAGRTARVVFSGQLTIVNSSNITTNTGTSIITQAGDSCIIRATNDNITEILLYSRASPIKLTASIATTSGTAIDFTGIPAGVKRVIINASGVSHNGTSLCVLQIGTSGVISSSAYAGTGIQHISNSSGVRSYTEGFAFGNGTTTSATQSRYGIMILSLLDYSTNTWMCSGNFSDPSGSNGFIMQSAGSKNLSGALDIIRLTTTDAISIFDAGSASISWEF